MCVLIFNQLKPNSESVDLDSSTDAGKEVTGTQDAVTASLAHIQQI